MKKTKDLSGLSGLSALPKKDRQKETTDKKNTMIQL
jgi:hypothetical protein